MALTFPISLPISFPTFPSSSSPYSPSFPRRFSPLFRRPCSRNPRPSSDSIGPHRIEMEVDDVVADLTLDDAELVYAEGEGDTSCVAPTAPATGLSNPHLETDV